MEISIRQKQLQCIKIKCQLSSIQVRKSIIRSTIGCQENQNIIKFHKGKSLETVDKIIIVIKTIELIFFANFTNTIFKSIAEKFRCLQDLSPLKTCAHETLNETIRSNKTIPTLTYINENLLTSLQCNIYHIFKPKSIHKTTMVI